MRSERWTDEARRTWVLERLREVVRTAAETPFYRDRFRAAGFDARAAIGFEDLAHLPVLTRHHVADHAPAMLSPLVPAADRQQDGTGGSTGVPLRYWSGPQERGWRISGIEHMLRRIGVPRGARTAYLWGHHLDRREHGSWRNRLREAATGQSWFDCFRLSPEILRAYHDELTQLRPDVLIAYASALDALAVALADGGLRARYPTRCLVTGAEKLWATQRAHIERVFDAPLHERYGSREIGLIAAQHAPRETLAFEVDWANVLVEPETDAPDSAILVTKLHADAMPMIRYRIDDEARFPAGSRPGHPAFVLEEILGRKLDGLHLPNGGWLHGVGIPHLMKDQPVREFQIHQHGDYSVDVLVVPEARYTDADGARIVATLAGNLPGIPIAVRVVESIPRTAANKWRPVVTEAVAAAPSAPGASPSPTATLHD